MKVRSAVAAIVVLAGGALGVRVQGQTLTWDGANSGTFETPGNWTPSAPTGSGTEDTVYGAATFSDITINSSIALNSLTFTSGTETYTFGGAGAPNLTVNSFITTNVANLNPVTFANSLNLVLGDSFGTVTLAGGSQMVIDSAVSGNGGLTVAGSGILTLGGAASYFGDTLVTGDATLQIASGGSISQTNYLTIGRLSGDNAFLLISNGASVENFNTATIGDFSGSTGTVSVDGAGSVWNEPEILYVSLAGTGTLSITNGGTVNSDESIVGSNAGGIGSVTVDGMGSTWNVGNLAYLGNYGIGSVTVTNGGSLETLTTSLGYYAGGIGSVVVDGSASSWANSNYVYVGYMGEGSVTVSNGASVNSGNMVLGYGGGSNGTLNLKTGGTLALGGGESTLAMYPGSATLNIGSPAFGVPVAGGFLNAGAVNGASPTDVVQFNTNATLGSPYYFTDNGTSGGLPVLLEGALKVIVDAGATVLNGSNSYSGGTTVNGAALTIGNDSGLGSGPVNATTGSTLNFTSGSPTVESLSLDGTTVNFAAESTPTIMELVGDAMGDGNVINLGGGSVLAIGSEDSSTFFGAINGPGSLVVYGGGFLELSGVSNYSGGTSIAAGTYTTLIASNSSALGTGPLTVNTNTAFGMNTGVTLANQVTLNNGGFLGGYGAIMPPSADPITVSTGSAITGGSGTIGITLNGFPQPIPGTLTLGSNVALTFGAYGILNFSIMNAVGTPGTDYSAINSSGSLNITASAVSPFTIQLISVDPGTQQQGLANFNPTLSYSWTLLTAAAGITNFNPTAFLVDSTTYFQNSTGVGEFYVTQSGNNLDLNFTPVPEPRTWVLVAVGISGIAAWRLRSRRVRAWAR